MPAIQEAAREIAGKIACENVSSEEIMLKICELCLSMQGETTKNRIKILFHKKVKLDDLRIF